MKVRIREIVGQWHATALIAGAIWILVAIWLNLPPQSDPADTYQRMAEFHEEWGDKLGAPVKVRHSLVTGFPFIYYTQELTADRALTPSVDFPVLLANAAMCLLAASSLAFVLQCARRFNLQMLFAVTAAAGVLFAIFRYLRLNYLTITANAYGRDSPFDALVADTINLMTFAGPPVVYLSPCVIAVGILLHRGHRSMGTRRQHRTPLETVDRPPQNQHAGPQ